MRKYVTKHCLISYQDQTRAFATRYCNCIVSYFPWVPSELIQTDVESVIYIRPQIDTSYRIVIKIDKRK